MNRVDLERASDLVRLLQRAERNRDAVLDRKIVGVVTDRSDGEGRLDPITIERSGGSGTGTITSISFTDDLETALTATFHEVFEERVAKLKADLHALGVTELY